MARLSPDQVMHVAEAWQRARQQFLREVSYYIGLTIAPDGEPADPISEYAQPYVQALDVAGAQIVAAMTGITKPPQILKEIAEAAWRAGQDASEKAREAAYVAGMAAAGFPQE